MVVVFDRVTFHYPKSQAGIFDVSLEVEEGELVAVIGRSGSGKSTLLKLLGGFLTPESGRILIDGADVSQLAPHRRNLGIVFQSYALFPHMSAWQNVAYPLKVRSMATDARRAAAIAALSRVGLGEFADRAPATLSGGQQQRIALARALVFQPRALLLDEPLSALDASLRAEMRDEILRVQRETGIATLHVTHDQEEALSIADRVAVMDDGSLLQVDAPQALYDRPVSRTVASFVGHANLWPGKVIDNRTVEASIGPITCDTRGFNAADEVTVLLRPENVMPMNGGDGAATVNRFVGTLEHDRFLGSLRRFDLRVQGGVIQGETASRAAFNGVSIPSESIRLLPAKQQ